MNRQDLKEIIEFDLLPSEFVSAMCSIDMIEDWEIISDVPYAQKITKLCNNASAFLYLKLMTSDIRSKLYLVSGSYALGGIFKDIRHEHSWVEYRDDNTALMIDLTVCQFRDVSDRIYVGPVLEQVNEWESVNFLDNDKCVRLLDSL